MSVSVYNSVTGADNPPTVDNFCVESCDFPNAPENGEVTIKSAFLSLDPAMVSLVRVTVLVLIKLTKFAVVLRFL